MISQRGNKALQKHTGRSLESECFQKSVSLRMGHERKELPAKDQEGTFCHYRNVLCHYSCQKYFLVYRIILKSVLWIQILLRSIVSLYIFQNASYTYLYTNLRETQMLLLSVEIFLIPSLGCLKSFLQTKGSGDYKSPLVRNPIQKSSFTPLYAYDSISFFSQFHFASLKETLDIIFKHIVLTVGFVGRYRTKQLVNIYLL